MSLGFGGSVGIVPGDRFTPVGVWKAYQACKKVDLEPYQSTKEPLCS